MGDKVPRWKWDWAGELCLGFSSARIENYPCDESMKLYITDYLDTLTLQYFL